MYSGRSEFTMLEKSGTHRHRRKSEGKLQLIWIQIILVFLWDKSSLVQNVLNSSLHAISSEVDYTPENTFPLWTGYYICHTKVSKHMKQPLNLTIFTKNLSWVQQYTSSRSPLKLLNTLRAARLRKDAPSIIFAIKKIISLHLIMGLKQKIHAI